MGIMVYSLSWVLQDLYHQPEYWYLFKVPVLVISSCSYEVGGAKLPGTWRTNRGGPDYLPVLFWEGGFLIIDIV